MSQACINTNLHFKSDLLSRLARKCRTMANWRGSQKCCLWKTVLGPPEINTGNQVPYQ